MTGVQTCALPISSFSTNSCGGSSTTSTTTSTWKNTFIPTDDEVIKGYTRALKSNERVRVKVEGQNHHVGIKSLNSDSVVIEISSNPQEVTLNIGDSQKFDVDENGIYDLLVTLNSITGNEAEINILAINEDVPEEEITPAGEDAGAQTEGDVASGTTGENSSPVNGNTGKLWLWIVIIVLVILVGIGMKYLDKIKDFLKE